MPMLSSVGIQFPIMFMFIGLGDVNPLLFVFSIVLVHGAVVLAGTKEPHLSTMIQAFGQTRKVTTNLYVEKGAQFEP